MNLNHLAVFHAVAATSSMTRAAERLTISQPAVSKQVRQLEREMKVTLFDRSAGKVRLTRAGEALAAYAGRIFDLVAEAEHAVGELSSLRRGTLSVGATPTLGAYLLPEVLVHFRRRFPGIKMRLEIGAARHLAGLLDDGAVDFVVSDVPLDTSAGRESEVIATETLVVIAPRRHPLAKRRSVTSPMLADLPFIVRETGSATRSFAERALALRGIAVRPALSLASTEAIKRAVAGGLGVAVVPEIAVRTELAARTLSVVRVPSLALRRPLYVTRRGTKSADAKPAIAFLYLLKHALRGSLPKLPSTPLMRGVP